jgi:hypothetical protein
LLTGLAWTNCSVRTSLLVSQLGKSGRD